MNKFVVVKDGCLMKVKQGSIVWLDPLSNDERDNDIANTYPSEYAAKKHLRTLENVPTDIRIVELVELVDS